MKTRSRKIVPELFILSALSPEARIDAAFMLAKEVFKKTDLTVADIQKAVKKTRKKNYEI